MPVTYINIASTTLSTTTSSVTFSSIPQTFTDLVLYISGKSATSNDSYLKTLYDNNTSAIYSYTRLYGDGSSVVSNRNSGQTSETAPNAINQSNLANSTNTFSNSTFYIPNYTSTTSKPYLLDLAQEANNATGVVRTVQASLFRNTSAITSLTMSGFFGGLAAGTSLYLYGIKNS